MLAGMSITCYPERTLAIAEDVITQIPETPLHVRHRGPRIGWSMFLYEGPTLLDTQVNSPDIVAFYTTIAAPQLPLMYYEMFFDWPDNWQRGDSATLHYRIYDVCGVSP